MNDQSQLDPIDALLREEAAYIDDGGFTAQIIRQLPVRRQRRSLRAVIFAAAIVVALVLIYALSGGQRLLDEVLMRAAVLPLPLMYLGAGGASLLVMVLGFATAMHKSEKLS